MKETQNLLEIKQQKLSFEEINLEIIIFNYPNRECYKKYK